MFNIILYQPEIPPNTGNIIRLCANTGSKLHLIKPLGFEIDHKKLIRAGLDYREFAEINLYNNLDSCLDKLNISVINHIYNFTTKSKNIYTQVQYKAGDVFIFGPETRGLPSEILDRFTCLRIPMLEHSRSLNLSNSVAVVVYEAWRQIGFDIL